MPLVHHGERSRRAIAAVVVAVAALTVGMLVPWWRGDHASGTLRGLELCRDGRCERAPWRDLHVALWPRDAVPHRPIEHYAVALGVGDTEVFAWLDRTRIAIRLALLATALIVVAAGLELIGRSWRGLLAPARLAAVVFAWLLLLVATMRPSTPASFAAQLTWASGYQIFVVGAIFGLGAALQLWRRDRARLRRAMPAARVVLPPRPW